MGKRRNQRKNSPDLPGFTTLELEAKIDEIHENAAMLPIKLRPPAAA
jgi:hypothetical protein